MFSIQDILAKSELVQSDTVWQEKRRVLIVPTDNPTQPNVFLLPSCTFAEARKIAEMFEGASLGFISVDCRPTMELSLVQNIRQFNGPPSE